MSTYLIVLLASVSVPFLKSFDKRAPFYKQWKYFFPATIFGGGFFILWDIWFTKKGFWGFNPIHLQGVYLFGLPIEEWLFFVCIPYACVFTYEVLPIYLQSAFFEKHARTISLFLLAISISGIILFYDNAYTLYTSALLATLMIMHLYFKFSFMGKFYFTYLIIFIPFFIVNGILTGSFIPEEVVWYNEMEMIGIRIGTIPLEDYFYGMDLMLMIVMGYEFIKKSFAFN